MSSGGKAALSDVNARLNAALKIISRVEASISDDAREWFDKGIRWADRRTKGKALPTEAHRRTYDQIVGQATVSVGVGFRAKGRHLVIYADARKAGRFVAGAVKTNDRGRIEGFTLKLWRSAPGFGAGDANQATHGADCREPPTLLEPLEHCCCALV